jgi:hypothetical protein
MSFGGHVSYSFFDCCVFCEFMCMWEATISTALFLFYPFLSFYFQALTSTAVKKGGLSTGDVAAQYKYKNVVVDVKVDTESNVGCLLCLKMLV